MSPSSEFKPELDFIRIDNTLINYASRNKFIIGVDFEFKKVWSKSEFYQCCNLLAKSPERVNKFDFPIIYSTDIYSNGELSEISLPVELILKVIALLKIPKLNPKSF